MKEKKKKTNKTKQNKKGKSGRLQCVVVRVYRPETGIRSRTLGLCLFFVARSAGGFALHGHLRFTARFSARLIRLYDSSFVSSLSTDMKIKLCAVNQ